MHADMSEAAVMLLRVHDAREVACHALCCLSRAQFKGFNIKWAAVGKDRVSHIWMCSARGVVGLVGLDRAAPMSDFVSHPLSITAISPHFL